MRDSEARAAFGELLEVLGRAADSLPTDRRVRDRDDVGEGLRHLTHVLQSALYSQQEFDPDRPVFRRIVSPTRSFLGDNPDAVYFEAPLSGDRAYVVRGSVAGAVYTSFTMEQGATEGRYATATVGALNDTHIDVADDGIYELRLGGEPSPRNWLAIPPGGGSLTTRHYFEWPTPAAAAQTLHIPLSIEPVEAVGATELAGPRPRWDDTTVAAAIRRVVNSVRGRTIDAPAATASPAFVSTVPNRFPPPTPPGSLAFAAVDAAYSMAPYAIGPDEALVITGRWPVCRFANVCLWNRWSQMYDYTTRTVSRNRANTAVEADGRFRIVLAHRDPATPNWLDTEGRLSGTIFWRFFLPEGPIETPMAQVVPFTSLRPVG